MSDALTIIAILVSIGIPLFTCIWQKYFLRPNLTIELLKFKSNSSPEGYSNNNISDKDGTVAMRTALQIFRLEWKIAIVIHNNSNYHAYYPDIYFEQNQPQFYHLENLNFHDCIASTEQTRIIGTYQEYEETIGSERTQIGPIPPAFSDFKILLKYRNFAKHSFYSLYSHSNKTTQLLFRKPKGFKKYTWQS